MGKKLATNFLAFGIKMTPSAVLVLNGYQEKIRQFLMKYVRYQHQKYQLDIPEF